MGDELERQKTEAGNRLGALQEEAQKAAQRLQEEAQKAAQRLQEDVQAAENEITLLDTQIKAVKISRSPSGSTKTTTRRQPRVITPHTSRESAREKTKQQPIPRPSTGRRSRSRERKPLINYRGNRRLAVSTPPTKPSGTDYFTICAIVVAGLAVGVLVGEFFVQLWLPKLRQPIEDRLERIRV